ncbi:MAG: GNAT family N-acetyltransferase [Mesorhizobium sp.]|nr:MAG: GNAT family N-acetyltransferase [Mesorhizobium sp.]
MPEPRPPAPNDIRLRKILDDTLAPPRWPEGFVMRGFEATDAPALHALLTTVFDDGADGPFDLCFLVIDSKGRLAGAALCWTRAFVKDLAVHPEARGRGVAEALMWHVFAAFRARGAAHVDLKTSTVENAAAVRLYERLGMFEVDWEG